MNAHANGTFGAENILTPEQLASVLTKAFKLKPKSMTTFDDVEKNYWATDSISAVQSNGISIGMGNNTFEPKTLVKR
ncbi:S-layer homology domain-containing protein, partial [Bacillus cereus]|nr:S-layer homology domain-containing protein [Bacillus cereus]